MIIFIIIASVVVLGLFLLAFFLGDKRRGGMKGTSTVDVPAPKGDKDTTG